MTAKIYGDIGYLTAKPEVGLELEELFKMLMTGRQETEFRHLLVAPKSLKREILRRIDREIRFHRRTGKGYLAFKLNNLEEKDVIQALYKASMAGIKIDLNVRGLCCLKPGIKGVSDNISVISIVGRFLEHARMYYFRDGAEDELLIGSSDLCLETSTNESKFSSRCLTPSCGGLYLRKCLKSPFAITSKQDGCYLMEHMNG